MYEVSNGTGVSSVLSSDIEVVAKRREIMIYVKQPSTTSTYRTGGCCRTTVFGGEGGRRRRPSGSKRQVLPPVLLLGEQRHHLKFYLLSRTVRMEATGKCQQQDGLTRSTRQRRTGGHRCCICARHRALATAAARHAAEAVPITEKRNNNQLPL
jgi:hypothetical protein